VKRPSKMGNSVKCLFEITFNVIWLGLPIITKANEWVLYFVKSYATYLHGVVIMIIMIISCIVVIKDFSLSHKPTFKLIKKQNSMLHSLLMQILDLILNMFYQQNQQPLDKLSTVGPWLSKPQLSESLVIQIA